MDSHFQISKIYSGQSIIELILELNDLAETERKVLIVRLTTNVRLTQ